MSLAIRPFTRDDWPAVSEIYRAGILTGKATFETEVPEFERWLKKFHAHKLWVATLQNKVVGWAGLQPVSDREVYEGVSEVSVYVHPDHSKKGIGKILMKYLIEQGEKAGLWTLYAAIFPENVASIKIHEATGFRKIGYREKIAKLDGKWRDTVLYERRSKVVGNS